MKFAFLVLATMVASFAQTPIKTQKVMPLPINELNQNFLKTCAEGEKIFAKVQDKATKKDELVRLNNELIKLVISLEYSLISELENRTPMEVKALKPARTCTKALTARVVFYIKNSQKSPAPEKVWQ